ncbi:MAG: hypothetical protein WC668_00060 [Patescibacteria group bacterium]|jgi:hypothetical protein
MSHSKKGTILVGVIKPMELLLKQRGPTIVKTGGVHGSKLGKKGYDRQRDKRAVEKQRGE